MPPALDRLFYVDDSGHPQAGRVVYGWACFEPHEWANVLGEWLELRRYLWREFAVPVTEELHTTNYVNGRARVSKRPPEQYLRNGVVLWKDLGRDVATRCLERVASVQGLRVGAVSATGEPAVLADTKKRLYGELLSLFEDDLRERDSLGMVIVDGDGSDNSYRDMHRALHRRTRRIIEDPLHQDSAASQLIQLADLIAWTANAHVDRHPGNAFAHSWYETYLSPRDIRRVPQAIQL